MINASFLAVLTAFAPVPTPIPSTAKPPDSAPCFQISFLWDLPTREEQQFLQDVNALQDAMAAGQPEDPRKLAQLRQEAETLRHKETLEYGKLSSLLTTTSAPAPLVSWTRTIAQRLAAPPALTSDETTVARTDPDTAFLLATLDECADLKQQSDEKAISLGSWIGLTFHQTGLWAADLGHLASALQEATDTGQEVNIPVGVPRHLLATAPRDTPTAVLAALTSLEPPPGAVGNLAGLSPVPTPVAPGVAATACTTLLTAYAAQSLAPTVPSPAKGTP